MVMNKKGQDLSLTTIILIVLGIAVLVFLIWGFSTGWTNLWDRVTAFTGGGVNVDSVKQGCELACTGALYGDWCENPKTLKLADKTLRGSCENLKGDLGISCSQANCGEDVYKQTCEDLDGEWQTDACAEGKAITPDKDERADAKKTAEPNCCATY